MPIASIWSKAPRGMNDGATPYPVGRRAQQRDRDVEEVPLVSDSKAVNVTASIVTTPLVKSGPCSGMRGSSAWLVCAKSNSGA